MQVMTQVETAKEAHQALLINITSKAVMLDQGGEATDQ